jgi:aflatoxin B1 aldehyde reductase
MMAARQPKTNLNIVFGAMTFGAEGEFPFTHDTSKRKYMLIWRKGKEQSRVHDLETCNAILDIFVKHGHREVDTARVYGDGTCEQYLGKLDWQGKGKNGAYPTKSEIEILLVETAN